MLFWESVDALSVAQQSVLLVMPANAARMDTILNQKGPLNNATLCFEHGRVFKAVRVGIIRVFDLVSFYTCACVAYTTFSRNARVVNTHAFSSLRCHRVHRMH